MSKANSEKPRFRVMNKAGQFLAKNPKVGRSHLPTIWVRDDSAETFASWSEAAAFGSLLPIAVQKSAGVVDQHGQQWTAVQAQKAKVFMPKAPSSKAKDATPQPTDAAAPAA